MSDITETPVPAFLREMLFSQYGALSDEIVAGYRLRPVTFRVNALKWTRSEALRFAQERGVCFWPVPWYEDAFIARGLTESDFRTFAPYKEGKLYLQSLSSMLPPLVLAPSAGENLLDMAAAPGGKTTELAALSGGKALISACEKDRIRFGRLSYNVAAQGAGRVNLLNTDALKLDEFLRFDKILLDAPCSGSGTLEPDAPVKISEKLVKNCAILQEKLLKKALRLLKKGGTLVYSTCSVLRAENEEPLFRALAAEGGTLVPLELHGEIPRLPSEKNTVCVRPTELYEGFFLAKIIK